MVPVLVTSRFLDQRRSVRAPVDDLMLFGSKEVSWGPVLVKSRFFHQLGQLGPRVGHIFPSIEDSCSTVLVTSRFSILR